MSKDYQIEQCDGPCPWVVKDTGYIVAMLTKKEEAISFTKQDIAVDIINQARTFCQTLVDLLDSIDSNISQEKLSPTLYDQLEMARTILNLINKNFPIDIRPGYIP